eukprot:5782871-Lingulodinium_polyedra.AAC.1
MSKTWRVVAQGVVGERISAEIRRRQIVQGRRRGREVGKWHHHGREAWLPHRLHSVDERLGQGCP